MLDYVGNVQYTEVKIIAATYIIINIYVISSKFMKAKMCFKRNKNN